MVSKIRQAVATAIDQLRTDSDENDDDYTLRVGVKSASDMCYSKD
jgi:hypothetical protein